MKNSPESALRTPRVRDRGWLTLAAGVVALVVYFGSRVLLERPDLSARLPVVLAPLPFFILFLAASIRLALFMALGLLKLAVVAHSPADWTFRHVWQIGVVLYGGGIALSSRRYGFR